MKKSIMITITNNLLFVSLLVFTISFVFVDFADRYSFSVLSVFFLIALCSFYGLFFSIDKKEISLNKTFCLFYYFFFSLAPITQFKYNSTFYFKGFISDDEYLKASLSVLMSLLFYLIFYHRLTRYVRKTKQTNSISIKNIESSKDELMKSSFFLSVISILVYFYLIKFNWDLLIFRPYSYDLKNNTNFGLIGYSLLLVVKLIPFIVFLNYVLQNEKYKLKSLSLFFLMLLTCFPTALSRGMLAIVYIPIMVLFVPGLDLKKYYISTYCFLILLIYPLFNMFRDVKQKGLELKYGLFNSGHFDAFHNFTLLLKERIMTNGEQLITSVLFFVPKTYWLDKSPGTGVLLAEKLNFKHTNIAMPLVGEGYANFGYLGIVVFIFFIVSINVYLENNSLKNNWIRIYFYIFLGFEFYLLRGDLWSSMKIVSSFSLAILIVYSSQKLLVRKNAT